MEILKKNILTTLNSVAQVVFIENWQFGLAGLITIGLFNLQCVVALFIALYLHNLLASKLYEKGFVDSGVSSFNLAITILVVYVVYGGLSSMWWVLLVTLIYTGVMYATKKLLDAVDIAFLSLPSILTSFILFYIGKMMPGLFGLEHVIQVDFIVQLFAQIHLGFAQHFIMDIGNIYFQANILFSVVLIVAYAILAKEYLLYYVTAFAASTLVYYIFDSSMLGTFTAFNGTLVLIVLKMFGVLKLDKSYVWVAGGFSVAMVLIEIGLGKLFATTGLPLLSLPFFTTTLAAQLYLLWRKKINKELETE